MIVARTVAVWLRESMCWGPEWDGQPEAYLLLPPTFEQHYLDANCTKCN